MYSDKKIDEGILQWFSYVKKENIRIVKGVYVEECAGRCSVGQPRKKWINTEIECLKKMRFGCQAI